MNLVEYNAYESFICYCIMCWKFNVVKSSEEYNIGHDQI